MDLDSLLAPIAYVRHDDPALDLARSDVQKYVDTMNSALLVEKPGQRARRWILRPIPANIMSGFISQAPTEDAINYRALQAALVRVDHLMPGDAWTPKDGAEADLWATGKKDRIASDHEVNMLALMFGYETIMDVGGVAYQRARLGPLAFGSAVTLSSRLLPCSRVALDQTLRLRAELQAAASETNSSAP